MDENSSTESAGASQPDFTSRVLASLNLGENPTQEEIDAAFSDLVQRAGNADAHSAQITELTTQLEAAHGKLSEIEKAKSLEEIDTLLAEYDLPEGAVGHYRELALANRDQAAALLSAVPKKNAASSAETPAVVAAAEEEIPAAAPEPPPEAVHEPTVQSDEPEADAATLARQITAETSRLLKENPRMPHSEARSRAAKKFRK